MVIAQSVMPGRTIRKNQNVEVTVSNGPKLVEIDDYSGKPINDVITMLSRQGLKYEIIRQDDDVVAANCIIRTNPVAHEFVEVGTTVTCYVSQGASDESTAVPQLINLSLASAENRAKEYEILLTVVREPSSEVEEGRVIRQSIDPTTVVVKNTIVEIVVSSGGAEEREATIKVNIKGTASGEFEFKYYIDGTLQENMTETKNMSLIDNFVWTFSNSGQHEYAVRVRSIDTGAEGTFFSCAVDFTQVDDKGEPLKDWGEDKKNFNGKVFKQLLSAVPTDDEPEVTTAAGTAEPDNDTDDNVNGDDVPVIPNDDGQIVAEG
jgi:serine/threonine-protein kinase